VAFGQGGESAFEAVGHPAYDRSEPHPTDAQPDRLNEGLELDELELLGQSPFRRVTTRRHTPRLVTAVPHRLHCLYRSHRYRGTVEKSLPMRDTSQRPSRW
jgi:hypothetical protein